MNLILIFTFVSLSLFALPQKNNKVLPVNKDIESLKKEIASGKKEKPEDCDDKAKKKIEIKPESISLGGQAGCSLDQHKP